MEQRTRNQEQRLNSTSPEGAAWRPHLHNNSETKVISPWSWLSAHCSKAWAVLQTFTFITFTRLFFRSGSNLDPATANQVAWETATNMMNQIGGAWDSSIIPAFMREYWAVVVLFVLGMVIHWLPDKWKQWYRLRFASLPLWAMLLVVAAVVFIVYQFITADMQPFIYFQF